jgi:hypothetical protein
MRFFYSLLFGEMRNDNNDSNTQVQDEIALPCHVLDIGFWTWTLLCDVGLLEARQVSWKEKKSCLESLRTAGCRIYTLVLIRFMYVVRGGYYNLIVFTINIYYDIWNKDKIQSIQQRS